MTWQLPLSIGDLEDMEDVVSKEHTCTTRKKEGFSVFPDMEAMSKV